MKAIEIPKKEKQGIDELLHQMSVAEIQGEDDYKRTAQMVQEMNARIKTVDKTLDKIVKEIYYEYKDALKRKTEALEPYNLCVKITKKNMAAWFNENERKRLEEKRRLEEIERKKAEEDMLAAAEHEGDEDILNEPIVTPEVKVEQPKVDKVSYREKWSFDIIDEKKIPREYLKVDEQKIRGVVQALKQDCSIPGIKIHCEKIPVLR